MKRKRTKRKSIITVPVASMGDIAFLLIIFFMVASRLITERNLVPPKSPDAVKLKESKISVSIDADGIIYLQGREVPDAKAVEWGVRTLVEGKTDIIAKTVMFSCDHTLTKDKFEPVIEAIAQGGGLIAAIGDQSFDETTTAFSPGDATPELPQPQDALDSTN
ncbi:MAG: biopolymer transporter ExbD [Lentisphaerae bacterium]|nr:biopolymer transporter ExbD [Lentisphaerota bacterium]